VLVTDKSYDFLVSVTTKKDEYYFVLMLPTFCVDSKGGEDVK